MGNMMFLSPDEEYTLEKVSQILRDISPDRLEQIHTEVQKDLVVDKLASNESSYRPSDCFLDKMIDEINRQEQQIMNLENRLHKAINAIEKLAQAIRDERDAENNLDYVKQNAKFTIESISRGVDQYSG
jgi:hypothetical protein